MLLLLCSISGRRLLVFGFVGPVLTRQRRVTEKPRPISRFEHRVCPRRHFIDVQLPVLAHPALINEMIRIEPQAVEGRYALRHPRGRTLTRQFEGDSLDQVKQLIGSSGFQLIGLTELTPQHTVRKQRRTNIYLPRPTP